jgi:hypothetical protein
MKAAEFFYGSSFTSANRPEPKLVSSSGKITETYSEQPCEHCGYRWRYGKKCASCDRVWTVNVGATRRLRSSGPMRRERPK